MPSSCTWKGHLRNFPFVLDWPSVRLRMAEVVTPNVSSTWLRSLSSYLDFGLFSVYLVNTKKKCCRTFSCPFITILDINYEIRRFKNINSTHFANLLLFGVKVYDIRDGCWDTRPRDLASVYRIIVVLAWRLPNDLLYLFQSIELQ